MKKLIIRVGIIASILIAIILNYDSIYKAYKLNQLRNDFINDINGKFSNRTSEFLKEEYELYHKSTEDLNHYNITELIDKYIEMAEESIEVYNDKKNGNKNIFKNYKSDEGKINGLGLKRGADIRMEYEQLRFDIASSLTETDIKNYNNGIFKSLLIKKLKSLLDYEEINGKIEWQINSINDMRIELPYDCYIDYKAYHREDNKEFKKAVDVIFDKTFELRQNLSKVKVKYETVDNSFKEVVVHSYYNDNDGKDHYRIDLNNGLLIYGADTLASAELKSYTGDRKFKERSLEIARSMRPDLVYPYD